MPAPALNAAGEGVIASAGSSTARKVRVALVRGRRIGSVRALGRGRDAVTAIGADGTAAVAWTGRRDALQVSVRAPGGAFRAPVRLARYGAEPRLAVSASGEVAVTWLDRRAEGTRALAAFGGRAGFSRPLALDTASFLYPVELAYDGGGDLALAWSAQAAPGAGPTWTVKVVHRTSEGGLGAVEEPGSGYAYDVRVARLASGATGVSWIGNRGPESGTLGPTLTAIAPAGGAFDGPLSPEPGNRRTLGARIAAVGESLLTVYTTRRGPLKATVRRAGGAFGEVTALDSGPVRQLEVAPLGDGAIVAWAQPRARMLRYTAGGWRRVPPPAGIPARSGRALATGGTAALMAWLDKRGRVRAAARVF
jgi:hypothetical protein